MKIEIVARLESANIKNDLGSFIQQIKYGIVDAVNTRSKVLDAYGILLHREPPEEW
jgi:type IV secretory pathway TrbF-like protein